MNNTVYFALRDSLEFFEARDLMNSHVHLQDVRWSPITIAVRQAFDEVSAELMRKAAESRAE